MSRESTRLLTMACNAGCTEPDEDGGSIPLRWTKIAVSGPGMRTLYRGRTRCPECDDSGVEER